MRYKIAESKIVRKGEKKYNEIVLKLPKNVIEIMKLERGNKLHWFIDEKGEITFKKEEGKQL